MKRNMDLIRAILIQIEKYGEIRENPDLANYDKAEIGMHVTLMRDHGLIEASVTVAGDGPTYRVVSYRIVKMNWEGYDFLEASRNDTIWQRAKKICLENTGGLTFDTLKQCLLDLASQAIK